MGIPSFFSYIIKNYPTIIKRMKDNNRKVNNLYLDSNSIIYDCMRSIEYEASTFENKLIQSICCKIDEYISIIKPTNTIIVAFDGVAPVAKLEQQRGRRYKSSFTKKLLNEISGENKSQWDQTAITPGTQFMNKLGTQISLYYKKNATQYGAKDIIVSTSNHIGEGEHKIFQFIRNNPKKHKNETSVIYGLDADLIMLCLNHLYISKNIYLYRETPEFIKSIDIRLIPNEHYILDIPLLSSGIINEMGGGDKSNVNLMFDYIFLCFFLGNDFMPHFPSVNIRTKGINILLNAYKATMGKRENFTNGQEIYWKNVRKFVAFLAENEWQNLKIEYRVRDRWEKRHFSYKNDEDKFKRFLHIPIKNREIEKYIDPYQSGWERRYYQTLFEIDITDDYRKEICVNYLEGLEWTFKYYTTGCVDWRWFYHYDYPPLFSDLLKYIPYWETTMIEKNNHTAVTPHVQLSYVLPKNSLHLLPEKIHRKLIEEKDEIYGTDCEFLWAFCKYFWECHPKLPHIHLGKLETFVHSINND